MEFDPDLHFGILTGFMPHPVSETKSPQTEKTILTTIYDGPTIKIDGMQADIKARLTTYYTPGWLSAVISGQEAVITVKFPENNGNPAKATKICEAMKLHFAGPNSPYKCKITEKEDVVSLDIALEEKRPKVFVEFLKIVKSIKKIEKDYAERKEPLDEMVQVPAKAANHVAHGEDEKYWQEMTGHRGVLGRG